MIIEIRDIPQNSKISKIVVDFDNGNPKTTIVGSNEKAETNNYDNQGLDLEFLNQGTPVSQEVVEKPVIQDKKREIKVSPNMQNLKI